MQSAGGTLKAAFTHNGSQRCKRRVLGISAEAMRCLQEYDWPGNVRELENVMEHAVLLGSTDVILPEDLPEILLEGQPATSSEEGGGYQAAVTELKKKLILQAVQQAGGNYTEAAHLLGVHPNYLHRLIRNLNLKATLRAAGERSAD